MSAPGTKLTPAEKRKATLAAKAAKELEDNIAFQNKSRKAGGRQAKQVANQKAGELVLKTYKPADRFIRPQFGIKTSLPHAKEPRRQQARETQDDADDGEPEDDQDPVVVKSKAKARKYPAPAIDIETDSGPEDLAAVPVKPFPRLDLANLPAKAKPTGGSKAKAIEATAGKTNSSKAAKLKPAAAKPVKIISESESESESSVTASSDSEANEHSSSEEGDDGPIDDADFLSEQPKIVSHRSDPESDAWERSMSLELDDRKAAKKTSQKLKKDAPLALFDSDSDEEAVVHVPSKKSACKSAVQATSVYSGSDDSMPDTPPPHGAVDSDIRMHERIADALVTIPLAYRSRRSSASSYSSGLDLSLPPSELGSELEAEPAVDAARPKKKSKKVSASRQKKADAEKPEIVSVAPTTAKGKAPVTTATRPESSWDTSARIALPAPNKDIGLTAQPAPLQAVLRGTMREIKLFMLFTEAYPLISSRPGFSRPYMIEVARSIGRPTLHILERLLNDAEFAVILAPIPLDRMNLLRGNMKRCAVSCILAFFQLADLQPEQVKARVEELLKDHRYIFPINPATASGGLSMDKPFRHGAIRFVLKEEVFTNTAFVTQNLDRFPATLARKPNERELPDAMVALAATTVYAALVEYRMTGHKVSIPFTEDAYEDTYRNHISSLNQVRKNAPVSLHKVLHGLFTDVTANHGPVHTASGSSATLIHLVDLPESD
ncbi:hypothetical protein DFH07DRAFT_1016427 [Mycena maculata]|uniref:DUF6532 domain-containing protein n=1 Tax=Mycena maculata TaxID=230809 RepID=A0AAD7JGU2_9AGAR|nr:hypothetical protein DFH07DRAFT_1016427 [Mycena maculata]